MDLKGRHLLKLLDFTPEEILYLVDHADELKAKKKQGIPTLNHPGKNIALIFEKNSTRTRCSFEVAANDLGMHTTFLDPSASQIGKKESIADTARVLGRIYDGIEYRGFDQSIVDDLAKYAGVPEVRIPERYQDDIHGRCPLQHGPFPDGSLCEDGYAFYSMHMQGIFPGC